MALVRLYTFNIKTEPKGLKRVGHKELKVPIVYGARGHLHIPSKRNMGQKK